MDRRRRIPVEGKADAGPGGIHCPCCQPVIGYRASKIFVKRYMRRITKQKLKKELHSVQTEETQDGNRRLY